MSSGPVARDREVSQEPRTKSRLWCDNFLQTAAQRFRQAAQLRDALACIDSNEKICSLVQDYSNGKLNLYFSITAPKLDQPDSTTTIFLPVRPSSYQFLTSTRPSMLISDNMGETTEAFPLGILVRGAVEKILRKEYPNAARVSHREIGTVPKRNAIEGWKLITNPFGTEYPCYQFDANGTVTTVYQTQTGYYADIKGKRGVVRFADHYGRAFFEAIRDHHPQTEGQASEARAKKAS